MNAEEYGKIIEESSIERDGMKVMPCATAFEISGRHGIALKDIGTWCDHNGIRIVGCQLGCFE
jgi:hypothetical protein